MNGTSVFDKRAAISALLDILMIFSRNDLKSELLKELDRHSKKLNLITNNLGVDTEKLKLILDKINRVSKKLYNTNGKIGINVMESDLLQSISQRSSIPGGTCSFDLPAFHYWLEQDNDAQQRDMNQWTQPLAYIRMAINLILHFIRQSSVATAEIAEAGFFQLALDKSKPFQLLRVEIKDSDPYFAEISGGRHRFTIRFMQASSNSKRPSQISNAVAFSLTRCVF
jgi:cell division protein ZapD